MMKLRGMALGVMMMVACLVWAGPAVADDTEMSIEQAGRAYVQAICVDVRGYRKFENKVWHGRDKITLPEARVRLPALRRAALTYSKALAESSRRLFNPEAGAWPADVESMIAKIANAAATESYLRRNIMGYARTAEQWFRGNGRANSAYERRGANPAKIRAMLNLSPDTSC